MKAFQSKVLNLILLEKLSYLTFVMGCIICPPFVNKNQKLSTISFLTVHTPTLSANFELYRLALKKQ